MISNLSGIFHSILNVPSVLYWIMQARLACAYRAPFSRTDTRRSSRPGPSPVATPKQWPRTRPTSLTMRIVDASVSSICYNPTKLSRASKSLSIPIGNKPKVALCLGYQRFHPHIIVKESLYQIYLFTKKLHRPLSWEIHYEGLGSFELRNFNSWTKFERTPSRSSLRTLASKVLDARHYTLNKFLLILMLLCQRFHYLWECTNKRFNYLWECINTFKCFLLTFRIIVSSEFHIYFFTQFLKPSDKL